MSCTPLEDSAGFPLYQASMQLLSDASSFAASSVVFGL